MHYTVPVDSTPCFKGPQPRASVWILVAEEHFCTWPRMQRSRSFWSEFVASCQKTCLLPPLDDFPEQTFIHTREVSNVHPSFSQEVWRSRAAKTSSTSRSPRGSTAATTTSSDARRPRYSATRGTTCCSTATSSSSWGVTPRSSRAAR